MSWKKFPVSSKFVKNANVCAGDSQSTVAPWRFQISSVPLIISEVKFKLQDWLLKLVALDPIEVICLGGKLIPTVPSVCFIHPHFWASSHLPPTSRNTLSQPLCLLYALPHPSSRFMSYLLLPTVLWTFSELCLYQVVSRHRDHTHVALGLSSGRVIYAVCKQLYFFSTSYRSPSLYYGL